MNIDRIWFALPCAVALSITGCSHAQRPAVAAPPSEPASQTFLSSAPVTSQQTTSVSPSIAVSDELMHACMLDVDDVINAPKFELDKSELTADDYAVLTRIGRCLDAGALSGKRVVLIGRADPRGSEEHNLALGWRRARRVAMFLEDFGIDTSRIDEETAGMRDATGTDEASWRRDRRVDILIAE